MRRGLAWAVLAALGVVLGMGMLQDRLLYFPQRATVEELAHGALRAWPSAADFRGLVAEPAGPARATVVVFHGNAGHAGDRAAYAAALVPLGLRTILAEYPGYGPRAGPLGEDSLVGDAVQTIERAHQAFGAPLLVVGESLGAGVAAAAAARRPHLVHGLMLITPWDRLRRIASHHYPWLPVRWLLRDSYDSVDHLAAFDRPKVVVVAMRDDIVPPEFGETLFRDLPGPKRLVRIEQGGHNDWFAHVDAAWWSSVMDTLLGAARKSG